jgi:hypothetical protein
MRPKKVIKIIIRILLIGSAVVLMFYKPLIFCFLAPAYVKGYLETKYITLNKGDKT